jgi:hypothetical protein
MSLHVPECAWRAQRPYTSSAGLFPGPGLTFSRFRKDFHVKRKLPYEPENMVFRASQIPHHPRACQIPDRWSHHLPMGRVSASGPYPGPFRLPAIKGLTHFSIKKSVPI